MTVRVYRWDDASAPVLTGEVGKLAALLKACLVTGYGSKTAAGWSNPYSATNVEAFTNSVAAGGTGYGIKVSHTNAQYTSVIGYEAIDGSGNLTNQFPTGAQLANGTIWWCSSTADTTPRPWLLVADEKRFYLWIGHSVTTGTGLATSSYMLMFFAGDLTGLNPADPYRFMVIGNTSASAIPNFFAGINSYVQNGSVVQGHYMARNLSGSTVSKTCGKTGGCYAGGVGSMGTTGGAYPDAASGGMLLYPVFVNDADATSQIRGHMPGLYNPIHNLPGNSGDTFSGVGSLGGKSFLLLDASNNGARCRVALETSDTWS